MLTPHSPLAFCLGLQAAKAVSTGEARMYADQHLDRVVAGSASADQMVRDALQQARQALQLIRAGRRDGATMGRCSSALDAVDAALAQVEG